MTRQSAQQLLTRLIDTGLVELHPDPNRRSGKLVRLTAAGDQLARDAAAVLATIDDQLGAMAQRLREDLGLLTTAATWPTAASADQPLP